MNSLFINETALHTPPQNPPPSPLLQAAPGGGGGIAAVCRLPGSS